ncbi:unnamed protein product [Paramecium sonneborni]|uniref:Uncharacterized protein n=1 Tax=Paramecium sonneborni TaxID=65129 RepID=A0A8S1RH19_9CILI|nr:unnamed protein product [Paramecium sonneborni]
MSKQCEFKIGNIVDPKLWANPRTMSSQQLQSFTSLEMVRLNYTFKTLKKSLPYIVGVISGCLITKFVVDGLVQGFIFGENDIEQNLIIRKWWKIIGNENISQYC